MNDSAFSIHFQINSWENEEREEIHDKIAKKWIDFEIVWCWFLLNDLWEIKTRTSPIVRVRYENEKKKRERKYCHAFEFKCDLLIYLNADVFD